MGRAQHAAFGRQVPTREPVWEKKGAGDKIEATCLDLVTQNDTDYCNIPLVMMLKGALI